MVFNPWANARMMPEINVPTYPDVSNRYAVETFAHGPNPTEQGWAPHLRQSPTDTPDSARLGLTPPRTPTSPDPINPPEEFWQKQDADDRRRHSVEEIHANGWAETKDYPGYPNPHGNRFAPNPRSTPPPEPRMTQWLSPRSYSFTRPTAFGTPREFNGNHFSMASHARKYEIYGMAPPRSARNTYRLTPEPWDTNVVDMPPAGGVSGVPDAIVGGIDVPYPSRSWRL